MKDAQKAAESACKRAEDEGASMVKCRDAARTLREAIVANDEPKADQSVRDLFTTCRAADPPGARHPADTA